MMKTCTQCSIEKEITAFHKDKGKKCGYKSKCKKCSREIQKQWENKNKDKRRKYRLKGEYGITPNDFDYLLRKQNGKCAICGITQCPTGRRFAVDHCHKTGKVRGLLCQACNTGLGKFNDSVHNLEEAVKYLKSKDNSDEYEVYDDDGLTDWK